MHNSGLPLLMALMTIIVFAIQWQNLDQIRQQVAAGLRSGLAEIARETGDELGKHFEDEVKKNTRDFHLLADSTVWDIPGLKLAAIKWNSQTHQSSITDDVLLAIVNYELGIWEIRSPNAASQQINPYSDQNLMWALEIERQLSPYGFWEEGAQNYWSQTLDSLILIKPQNQLWEQDKLFICQPIFELDSDRLMALVCHPVNHKYVKEELIPKYFRHTFIEHAEPRVDGIRREFLHSKLSGKNGSLFYNSAVRGRSIMEQRLDLAKISPYLDGIVLQMGFLGTHSENVANALHRRNQWLMISILAIFLGLTILIYRTLQKADKLDRLKSHFLANVTHELKTPLSGIMLANDTIRLDRISKAEDLKENSEIIYHESRRLQTLVNKLLDFSNIELNETTIKAEKLNANAWLEKQLFVWRKRAEAESFGWNVSLDKHAVMLKADPLALQTVIEILLDNAIRYSTDNKQIHINSMQTNDHWVLEVTDEGPGIPIKHQATIFNKFVRLNHSDVHDTKGMGIGLSIAKSIIEAHGGYIKLKSRPGKGSTFSIHLPI